MTEDRKRADLGASASTRKARLLRAASGESREAALSQVEHDTDGFQKKAVKAAGSDPDKVAADTARYEALAREHGADLSEERFNEALRKVARQNTS